MKIFIVIIVIIAIGVGGYLFQNNQTKKPQHAASEKEIGTVENHTMHNDHAALVKDDRTFILGMIPHHEEAVTSSQALLQVATTPEVRTLAENIITAQEKEIMDMNTWYQEWFNEPYEADGKYQAMMRSIEGKTAIEAERIYLQDMIMHHKAAVAMAQAILPITEKEELQILGNNIIRTQNQEIAQMHLLLGEDMAEIMNMHQGH